MNNWFRQCTVIGLILLFFNLPLSLAWSQPNPSIQLVINGQLVQPVPAPIMLDNRTLVPLRWIAEALGAEVSWDDMKRAVLINSTAEQARAKGEHIQIIVNGTAIETDVHPVIIDGSTMVPVRFIAEALGTEVTWDQDSMTISIQSMPNVTVVPKSFESTEASSQLVFHHHFNDLTLLHSKDFVQSGNGAISVQSINSSNAALLLDGTKSKAAISRQFSTSASIITGETKFKLTDSGDAVLLELAQDELPVLSIIAKNGQLQAGPSSSPIIIGHVQADRWYTVKVIADPVSHANIYLNESPVASILLLEEAAGINKIAASAEGTKLYLDDLLVGEGVIDIPSGFASVTKLTTGGLGGKTVVVSSPEQFVSYIKQQEPYTIIVQGELDLSFSKMHKVASNKTIFGQKDAVLIGGGLQLEGVENVIIRNLTFHKSLDDAIEIRNGSQHIWIDHNSFGTQQDGGIDIRLQSSFVTVSWNHFLNTGKTSLIGSSDNETGSRGYLKVSYHHNLFENTNSRNPMVRFGEAHVYNNYYLGVRNYGIRAYTEGSVLSESNFFRKTKTPMEIVNGTLQERGSFFEESGQPLSNGTVFQPAGYYTYSLDLIDQLDLRITEWAGAGKLDASMYYDLNS